MKNSFKIFACAALAFSFFACSDSTSSNPSSSDGESSSSAQVISMSSVSEESPMIMDIPPTLQAMSDGKGGYSLKLSGNIRMDYSFKLEGYEDEEIYFLIDSLSFLGAFVKGDQIYDSDLEVRLTNPNYFAGGRDNVSLGTLVENISLSNFEGCGPMRIFVTAYASIDPDGLDEELLTKLHKEKRDVFSSRAYADFDKPCPVEEVSSSSVEAVCTELEMQTATLSNMMGTDTYTLNLLTGGAENPHLTLTSDRDYAYLEAAAGVEIWEERNQDLGILAEPDEQGRICLEHFSPQFGTSTTKLELTQGWFLVKTPDGDFPIMVGKISQSMMNASVPITWYRPK